MAQSSIFKGGASRFVVSCPSVGQLPKGHTWELAVLGRSNVGKSTLLNRLMRKKGLAITSNTPGRTQMINVFTPPSSDPRLLLMDLPGYGYAKVPNRMKSSLHALIDSYIREPPAARSVQKVMLHLIDARRGIGEAELQYRDTLRAHQVPFISVFTKADKLSALEREFLLQSELNADEQFLQKRGKILTALKPKL